MNSSTNIYSADWPARRVPGSCAGRARVRLLPAALFFCRLMVFAWGCMVVARWTPLFLRFRCWRPLFFVFVAGARWTWTWASWRPFFSLDSSLRALLACFLLDFRLRAAFVRPRAVKVQRFICLHLFYLSSSQ